VRRRLQRLSCALALLSYAGAATVAGEPASVSEAFVTNQTDDSLSIVSLADLKVAETLKIGGKPAGIAMSADGSRAYLTSPEGKEVVVVDADARKI
jgi:YVTN family beta-propeller protein